MAPETKQDAFVQAFSKPTPRCSIKCILFGCSHPNQVNECPDCGRPEKYELDGIIVKSLMVIARLTQRSLDKIYNSRHTLMF